MQLWRHIEQAPEFGRAEFLLAGRPGAGGRPSSPLEVTIAQREPRQNDERCEDRRAMAGMSARIVLGSGAFEAHVANLSSSGMMIACERILPIGSQASAEIDGCAALPMTLRWVRGGRIGLEFHPETVIAAQAGVQRYIVDAIRAGASPEQRGAGWRYALLWVCQLATGGGMAIARMRNISRAGALLSFGDDLAPITGETVTLMMGEASRFEAQVRWSCDGLAGLRFADHFPVEMLIEQPCARIVEAGDERSSDAPETDYQPLTLRELYAALYSEGDPTDP